MVIEKLAAELARLREAKGVTQGEVASALGVSDKTVSKWETAASAPDIELLPALADYYGVTVGALFGSDEKKPDAFAVIRECVENNDPQGAVNGQFRQFHDLMKSGLPRYDGYEDSSKLPVVVPEHIGGDGTESGIEISVPCGYQRFIDGDDLKIAAAVWSCPDNFKSMLDNADKYRPLFSLLSQPHAVKFIAKIIYTEGFPSQFTDGYAAAQTGVGIGEASAMLDECVKLGLLYTKTALLTEGEKTIYSSVDNGAVLAIIALAYSAAESGRGAEYRWSYGSRLIRDTKGEETK